MLRKISHLEKPELFACNCQFTKFAHTGLSTDYQQPIRVSGPFTELKEILKVAPVDTVEKTFDRRYVPPLQNRDRKGVADFDVTFYEKQKRQKSGGFMRPPTALAVLIFFSTSTSRIVAQSTPSSASA
jgi:hypothetical protein